jgi:hypothetical protein
MLPPGTDIRDPWSGTGADLVECPLGTGRFYRVAIVDDVAKGHANEYRVAMIYKVGTWPTPIP